MHKLRELFLSHLEHLKEFQTKTNTTDHIERETHQHTEKVEIFSSTRVVTALILELSITVKCVQVLLTKLNTNEHVSNSSIYFRFGQK